MAQAKPKTVTGVTMSTDISFYLTALPKGMSVTDRGTDHATYSIICRNSRHRRCFRWCCLKINKKTNSLNVKRTGCFAVWTYRLWTWRGRCKQPAWPPRQPCICDSHAAASAVPTCIHKCKHSHKLAYISKQSYMYDITRKRICTLLKEKKNEDSVSEKTSVKHWPISTPRALRS